MENIIGLGFTALSYMENLLMGAQADHVLFPSKDIFLLMLQDFEGVVSPAVGALCVDLTIGSKTLPTTFFVINGKGSYILLLGKDWIHANCCIPSTMHQCLIQWIGDVVEVVAADSSFSTASAEASEESYER